MIVYEVEEGALGVPENCEIQILFRTESLVQN
jgi:hypothetical protein